MALKATTCNGVEFLHRKLQIELIGKGAPVDKIGTEDKTAFKSKFTSLTNKADKV